MKFHNQYKIVVYTALTGNYESLNEQGVFETSPKISYVCFTDNEKLESTNWNVKFVKSTMNPVDMSRWIKMKTAEQFNDSTILCYKDNSVVLLKPVSEIVAELLGDSDIAFMSHSSRRTLFGEFVVCEAYKKDSRKNLRKHFSHVLESNMSTLFKKPLWGGFFALKVNDRTIGFLNTWHDEFTLFSKRDQLSLVYSLNNSNSKYRIVKRSNRFSEWHSWPTELGRSHRDSLTKRIGIPYRIQYFPRVLISDMWYFSRILVRLIGYRRTTSKS